MTTVQIKLSNQIANEARRAGLLSDAVIEQLLRDALRNERINAMRCAQELLATNPPPLMSPEEIRAEIDAYREQTRRALSS